ncbi:hypothetical protein KXX41_006495, partial [Aspergillus fumigatus]
FVQRLKEGFREQFGDGRNAWSFRGREVRVDDMGSVYDLVGYSERVQRVSSLRRAIGIATGGFQELDVRYPGAWENADVFIDRCVREWKSMEEKGLVVGEVEDEGENMRVRMYLGAKRKRRLELLRARQRLKQEELAYEEQKKL